MDAVYAAFQARIDALVFPGRSASEYPAYAAAVAEIDAEFQEALAAEYLGDIAESRIEAIANGVYALAYENGHASGRSEVENQYIELADLANLVYRTATS